jgi:hypothetical protein
VVGPDPKHRLGRRKLAVVLVLCAIASVVALGVTLSEPNSDANPPAGCPRVKSSVKPRPFSLIIGANSVWNRSCDLKALASNGIRWERFEIDWSTVEPKRGRWTWSFVDHQFTEAARAHVTILPLLMGPPGWAESTPNTIPANPSGFANFVARVVRRYGTGGSFWRAHRNLPNHATTWFEIWNEPYLSRFSAGGPQPDKYARLLKASTIAGRNANPSARFLIEAETTALDNNGNSMDWVGGMYAAVPDLNNYFDGVAAHPYTGPGGPDVYTPGANSRGQFRRIQELHDAFLSRGATQPFWITEVGWSTCPGNSETCVTQIQQAQYTGRMFQIVKTEYRSWVRAVFLYNYRDSFRNVASDKEFYFGMLRHNGTPKPIWNVIRHAASTG